MRATSLRNSPPTSAFAGNAPGLEARQLAQRIIEGVLVRRHSLDDVIEHIDAKGDYKDLASRDRAFARLIATTVLRRHGSLDAVIQSFIERPLPEPAHRTRHILLIGAAQLLLLDTPPHAAINLAVEHCRHERDAQRYGKLVNAVLRRVATLGREKLAALDWPKIEFPDWMWHRWIQAYGESTTREIAAASLTEAALDVSVKSDRDEWAKRLGGQVLKTGSIRVVEHGRVEDLDGFADGTWWIQDAAAALPARLLGDVQGQRVADLCAAPGGKTASLASAGALVTAVDRSNGRLKRLSANMQRLGLQDRVTIVNADLRTWEPAETFDAVLLDAPCTATGTLRRHPDILHLKQPGDMAELAKLQQELLARAVQWVRPGGLLVYCTCSLEPEEGPERIATLLQGAPAFERVPIVPGECGVDESWITPTGELRTFPHHAPGADGTPPGLDGFYAVRLRRKTA